MNFAALHFNFTFGILEGCIAQFWPEAYQGGAGIALCVCWERKFYAQAEVGRLGMFFQSKKLTKHGVTHL